MIVFVENCTRNVFVRIRRSCYVDVVGMIAKVVITKIDKVWLQNSYDMSFHHVVYAKYSTF